MKTVGPASPSATPRPGRARKLHWWAEVLAVAAFYAVYSAIRNANEGGVVAARHHARQLIDLQKALHINVEETVQDWALHIRPLIIAANWFYGSLHFIITTGVIVWMFRKFPSDYPRWRNTLALTTGLALFGFILWPLMPPRLLPASYSFIDTLAEYPTPWSFNSGALHKVSNQYAAMPSLHFGWAMFCCCAIAPRMTKTFWRGAAYSYPVVTLTAIVITGNHYILDAVAGAAVFGVAFSLAKRFTRPTLAVVKD